MREATRNRRAGTVVATVLAVACGSKGSGVESGTDATGETGSESATDGDWPMCEPPTIDSFGFGVLSDAYDAPNPWPDGEYEGACSVEAIDVEGRTTIKLTGCVDSAGDALPRTLDFVFGSNTWKDGAPSLTPGQSVHASYTVVHDGWGVANAWYSLRDAETDDLLFGAFCDPGPELAPKPPDAATIAGWLAPFDAEMGPFVCAKKGICGDIETQRALARFSWDEETADVISGTEADLGSYLVHLGYAGVPEACEGRLLGCALYGFIVRKH